MVYEPGVGGCSLTCGAGNPSRVSSLNSTLIILPWCETGGGGLFLPDVDIKSLLSSSGSDISCDVRGDSGWGSCIVSNIDCLDRELVSVLLPPSPKAWVTCACDADCAVGVLTPEFPVISSLLKASTSIDARPGLETCGGAMAGLSRPGFSMVSNVFENGFAGALPGCSCPSSSEADSRSFR